MIGIYLASFKAEHHCPNLVYQDINGKRDIGGDMMDVDLEPYDYVIASPPCNFWSRANYRRYTSEYSQKTFHLLIEIVPKLIALNKPFIVENVRNPGLFNRFGLFNQNCLIYQIGRHTYWTNILLPNDLIQEIEHVQNHSKNNRQGDANVNEIIEYFLSYIGAK